MTRKEQFLLYLKKEKGAWVSGERFSGEMSITRAAIWKYVCQLKDEGYQIESSPKKGYRLLAVPDVLSRLEIQDNLQTKKFGKENLHCFYKLTSTNTKAVELALAGAPEGTVVVSELQSHGRGRLNRNWFSPPEDGIYISLIIRPFLSPLEASKIPLMSSVVVANMLHTLTGLDIQIKWPNDILVKGRKIGGILTEINTELDAIRYMVVGVGLNINNSFDSFPEDLSNIATSVLIETGAKTSRINMIKQFLEHYEDYYETLRKKGFSNIINDWKKYENVIGKRIEIVMISGRYTGTVKDVDEDGALIVQNEMGENCRIYSGDLMFLDNINMN